MFCCICCFYEPASHEAGFCFADFFINQKRTAAFLFIHTFSFYERRSKVDMKKLKFLSIFMVFIMIMITILPCRALAEGEEADSSPSVQTEETEPAEKPKKEEKAPEENKEEKNKDNNKDNNKEDKTEKKETVHVNNVSISKSSLSLKEGSSEKLSVELSPGNAENTGVSWKSSDESVATVDSHGNVTGKSAGTAKITVTSNDGGLTAECTVNVSSGSSQSENGSDKNSSGDASNQSDNPTVSGNESKDQSAANEKSGASASAASQSAVKSSKTVDDAEYKTSLADGTYTDFDFTWGGGTGKANLSLKKIIVEKGIARGEFTASSANMTHVYYAGHTGSDTDDATYYDPDSDVCGPNVIPIKESKVIFPVKLNSKTEIACRTTAMTVPHWVQYDYTIKISEPENFKIKLEAENEDEEKVSATYTVKNASGETVQAEAGSYTLEKGKAYTLTAQAEGYEDWTGTVTPSQDGETITLLMTAKVFTVKVKVTDQDSSQEIENCSVAITDEKTGKTISQAGEGYPLSAIHQYTVAVTSSDDYEDARLEHVAVKDNQPIEIALKALTEENTKKYPLTVIARDEDGSVIEGAKVEVIRESSTESISIKPSDGIYELIGNKNYTVRVSAQGYESMARTVSISGESSETFTLKKLLYDVHVRVIDSATEYNLSKASVQVTDSKGKTYQADNGTYSVPYHTSLTVTASCTGYESSDGQAQVSRTMTVESGTTITLSFTKKTYMVKVSAVDASSGKAISGAGFTVTNSETGKTISATDSGYPMTYSTIYTIEATASGYAASAMTHRATADDSLTIKLTPTSTETSSSDASSSSSGKKTERVVNDGTYNIKFKDAENSMFNVVGVVLHVKNGKYTADISLSGKGYDYVYPSTAAAAIKAGKSKWSKYWKNSKGLYTYTIEVPYLDKPFILASRSIKYANDPKMKDQAWRDGLEAGGSHGSHEIILYSKYTNGKDLPTHEGTRAPSSIPAATDSNSPKRKTTGTGKNKKGTSSATGSAGSKSTSAVNNTTGLKDGTYKPDSFSFSGGTGKVQITCNQVIVRGGKTYARITFSSTYFQYVKAGGQKITNYTRTSSSTSFVIPVELNKNNTIVGMTTKMSQPHEIAYTIFVGLNAAKTAGGAAGTAAAGAAAAGAAGVTSGKVDDQYDHLDAQAPEIIGLTYQGELPVTYTDKIKIFQYQDGFSLIELDVRKGTALDSAITGIEVSTADESQQSAGNGAESGEPDVQSTERTEGSENQEDASAAGVSKQASQAGGAVGGEEEASAGSEKTASELKAALYDNAVYKYLIVPENGTVPAGIEKQLFVVQLPADKTVVTSPDALEIYDALGIGNQIMGIGIAEEEITVDAFLKAMKEKNGESPSILSIGSYDKPDYKKLLLNKADVLIEDPRILPKLGSLEGFPQTTKEEFAKLSDQEKAEFQKQARDQAMKLKKIGMRGVQLGMGVLVDRRPDEENDLAKAEWLKIYGVLYNKASEVEAMYKNVVDKASDEEKKAAAEAAGHSTAEPQAAPGSGSQTGSQDGNPSGNQDGNQSGTGSQESAQQ